MSYRQRSGKINQNDQNLCQKCVIRSCICVARGTPDVCWNVPTRDKRQQLDQQPNTDSFNENNSLDYQFFSVFLASLDRASDCQCHSRNSPGFDHSILRHSGIFGAADEAVLNKVCIKKSKIIHLLIVIIVDINYLCFGLKSGNTECLCTIKIDLPNKVDSVSPYINSL